MWPSCLLTFNTWWHYKAPTYRTTHTHILFPLFWDAFFPHFNISEIRMHLTNVWPFQETANCSITASTILPPVRLELFLFSILSFQSQSWEPLKCQLGSCMPGKHAAGPGNFLYAVAWLWYLPAELVQALQSILRWKQGWGGAASGHAPGAQPFKGLS